MSFSNWVLEQPSELSVSELAQRAIVECPLLVLSVLEHEVEHLRRALARDEESRRVVAFMRAAIAPERPRVMPLLPLQPFALGNGIRVTWAEATVAQHRERVDRLRLHVRGVEETIARHEDAIALLERTGSRCLADVEGHEKVA